MRILDKSGGTLTNFEVFRILDAEASRAASERELLNGARRTVPHVSLAAQRTVVAMREQMMHYLSRSPCVVQSEEQIASFVQQTADLPLTTSEILQCINLRPEHTVEVYLIVDACESRLGSDGCKRLLDACAQCLAPGPKRTDEDDGDRDRDGEDDRDDDEPAAGASTAGIR